MEIVVLFLWLLCGLVAGSIYASKGRPPARAFFVGVLFGPLGVLLALLSSTDRAALERKAVTRGGARKCPHCAEIIRAEAVVCRFCGRDLPALAAARR